MRSLRTSFPILAGIVLGAGVLPGALAAPARAQNKPEASPIIAGLLPSNSSIRGGEFNLAGEMGLGSGAADLPFDHPCLRSSKFPGRVSIALTYYGGEMAQMLQMQGPMVNEQTLENAMGSMDGPGESPMREKLGIGEIVYVYTESTCQPETIDTGGPARTYPPTPRVKIIGVALTANARLEVDLGGGIPLDQAKGAVAEIFEKLAKTDFSKAK
ncbi:MAG TPA: hypothetical protein VLH75_17970 [Longimicrobiales bacterium]|nr:hypothetical protein [Longimicrobiales bacterium]